MSREESSKEIKVKTEVTSSSKAVRFGGEKLNTDEGHPAEGAKESEIKLSKDGLTILDSRSDKLRMWAAICFAFMLIVVGIPLWWKTTEVYRAPLPFDRISLLDPMEMKIGMSIKVYSDYPTRANHVIRDLKAYFIDTKLYKVNIKAGKIDLDIVNVSSVEASTEIHPKTHGEILLVQVDSIPEYQSNILVSNHRIIYFTQAAKINKIGDIISRWMLLEEDLLEKIESIVAPNLNSSEEKESHKRLRASSSYLVVFTIVNSDPESVRLVWDIQTAISVFIKPLLDQIRAIGEHKVKSQWLYMVDLGETPTKTKHGYTLSFAQLPHIITPLEKKLGSGTSKEPCVHLILYTPGCEAYPLSFLSETGDKVRGMVSPQWGAIQLLNPSENNCKNGSLLVPESHKVMGVFVSQFHTLLGIKEIKAEKDVGVMKMEGPLLRDWELDVLYRIRVVDQITSSCLTLQSLAKLLGEISNIVINEEVAGSVGVAVDSVEKALGFLQLGLLEDGLVASSVSYEHSETAFSHPSLLALLYFPDDQKYAVYIPLFLPIMIPVLMSLKNIYYWITSKKSSHEKTE